MDRLYYTPATFPANTPIGSPVSIPWALEDNELVYVDINIPPGPSGTMGFRILWANQQIVPWANNSYLVTDNEKIHVDTNTYMTLTGLVIQGYNTDIFPHTIYIRGLVRTASMDQIMQANELSGNLALPASTDTSGVNAANPLVSTGSILTVNQLGEDMSIGGNQADNESTSETMPEPSAEEMQTSTPSTYTIATVQTLPPLVKVVNVANMAGNKTFHIAGRAHVKVR